MQNTRQGSLKPRPLLGTALLVSVFALTGGCAAGDPAPPLERRPPTARAVESEEASTLRDSVALPTLVIVVRHAEKATVEGDDPPLSQAGEARARALARALENASVTAVFTTQYVRTTQTAAPAAHAAGVTPQVLRAEWERLPEHAAEVSRAVRRNRGGVVLVVGHSNTVPEIVAALGADRPREICEWEYDRMTIVILDPTATGPARQVESRYGAPTAARPGCDP